MQTCKKCGEHLEIGSKFCPHCGSKQDNIPINYNQIPNYNQQTQPYQNNNYNRPYQNNNYNRPYQNNNYNQPYKKYPPQRPNYVPPNIPSPYDSYSQESENPIGWGILGGLIPIAGLILFLVWQNTRPRDAKAAGIGALVGFVINLTILAVL